MAAKPLPCPTLARLLVHYDPEAGSFVWKPRHNWMFARKKNGQFRDCATFWNRRQAGKRCGTCVTNSGYRFVNICGERAYEHHLAWALTHGKWPDSGMEIDHIDGDRINNRIENLRLATRRQNAQNIRRQTGPSGFTGVHRAASGRWIAKIRIDGGKRLQVGTYDTPELAARAYDAAAIKLRGRFASLNFP